jgi:hypothetical protein
MAGAVHLPWYSTGFRADRLEQALMEVAPSALRYGATSYQVHRYRDDRYKFLHICFFPEKLDFDRWWSGEEMVRFRITCNGWYQVPMTYAWSDVSAEGSLPSDPIRGGEPSTVIGVGEEPGDVF